jgi:hypothetical protein
MEDWLVEKSGRKGYLEWKKGHENSKESLNSAHTTGMNEKP